VRGHSGRENSQSTGLEVAQSTVLRRNCKRVSIREQEEHAWGDGVRGEAAAASPVEQDHKES
jgi:hypothetical protein